MARTKRSKQRVDYRASWTPVIEAANAKIAAGAIITRDTAFGTLTVRSFSFSEVTGPMFHTGSGLNAASYVADLAWLEQVAGVAMQKVVR